MTRLIGVELRRLTSRRATRVILSLPFLVFAIVALIQSVKSHQDGSGSGAYIFADHWPADTTLLVVLVTLSGFLIGASAIGAEWSAGTYAHLLLWEPRRLRVLSAKTLATLTLLLVAAVAGFAWCAGMDALTTAVAGSFDGASGKFGEVLTRFGRGLLVIGVFTAIGSAVAGIARNSAAALGALVAYFVVGEGILRGVWAGGQRWTLVNNAQAVVLGRLEIQSSSSVVCGPQGCVSNSEGVHYLTDVRSAGYLLAVVAVLTVLSALRLTRRDVT